MKKIFTYVLFLLLCCSFLVACDDNPVNNDNGNDNTTDNSDKDDINGGLKYTISIGNITYELYKNYLVNEELYIQSNIKVKSSEVLIVKENDDSLDVIIQNGANNIVSDNGSLKIHNDATAQISLTKVDGKFYLFVSGYKGLYSTLESTVKDGYVVGYSYKNNISYTGYIKDGVPHGEGIYIWSLSNCIYFGEFVNGKYEGEGTFVWHNGDKLVGQFADGAPVSGSYTYASSNCTYTGGFNKDWKYHGQGIFTWPSGWKFEGTFENGKAVNGKTYTNRSTGVIWYEGAMNALNDVNSNVVGKAYYVFANGCTYTGGYRSKGALETWKYQGEGVFTWPSGWKFEGTFNEGLATYGKTTTTKTKGLIWYEGAMNDLNNIKSSELGTGYYIQDDGTIYVGQMYASGALNSCTFHGEGKLIYTNGTEVTCTYNNGQLVSSN